MSAFDLREVRDSITKKARDYDRITPKGLAAFDELVAINQQEWGKAVLEGKISADEATEAAFDILKKILMHAASYALADDMETRRAAAQAPSNEAHSGASELDARLSWIRIDAANIVAGAKHVMDSDI